MTTPLLTAAEVAALLKVSRTTVYRLAHTGALGCVRLRRPGTTTTSVALRFTEQHIAEYIDAQTDSAITDHHTPPRRTPRPLTDLQHRYPHLQPPSHRRTAS